MIQLLNFLIMSISSFQGLQRAPDLLQLIMGIPQLTLKLQHHTLVLFLHSAVELLQLPVLL